MTTKGAILTAGVFLMAGISTSLGNPVLNPANGHYYDMVLHFDPTMSWGVAKAEAETKTYLGVNGYLGTITSQQENDFLANNILTQRQHSYYLGGYSSGGWHWVTGEAWSYTNWKPGEPSGGENYLSIIANPPPDAYGQWNDVNSLWEPGSGTVCQYIIEYPVPEPATLSLLGLGGLAFCRRRDGR